MAYSCIVDVCVLWRKSEECDVQQAQEGRNIEGVFIAVDDIEGVGGAEAIVLAASNIEAKGGVIGYTAVIVVSEKRSEISKRVGGRTSKCTSGVISRSHQESFICAQRQDRRPQGLSTLIVSRMI